MTNWKICATKQARDYIKMLSQYLAGETEKHHEKHVRLSNLKAAPRNWNVWNLKQKEQRIADLQAEIRTRDLPNKQKLC
jgi:hypothetical protein